MRHVRHKASGMVAVLIMALMIIQCMSLSALAIDEAGFSNVVITPNVTAQQITITGNVTSAAVSQVSVIIKRPDKVIYINQFETENDGAFNFVIPTSFKVGDVLTVQLGGVSSNNALIEDVTVSSGTGGGSSGGTGGGGSGGTGGGSSGGTDTWVNPFQDIASDIWYYKAVSFVSQKGLFNGSDATHFSPSLSMSRAMLVTVLYRAAESSAHDASGFSDVPSGSWYASAVAWASSQGIVNGVGGGKFAPDNNVTREQIAAILYRYAQKTTTVGNAAENLRSFTDGSKVSSYALEGVKWAVGNGILSGRNNGVLDSGGLATRAEVATMLMRFLQLGT